MLINKEYPATHSMSTAWYIADDDGNVGIMEFEDNGPVPECVPGDNSTEDLVYGCDTEWNDVEIDFTEEQIEELLTSTELRSDENWSFLAIKVQEGKEKEFEKLCSELDIDIERSISHKFRLYKIFVNEKNGLSELITSGVIEKAYLAKNLWMNDEWKDDELKIIKNFDSVPFYIFYQPYWTGHLPVKVCSPQNPVKINQLPKEIRDKVLKIPGRFSERTTFQIAQIYPSSTSRAICDPYVRYKGCAYTIGLLELGEDAYVMNANDEEFDMAKAKIAPLVISKEEMADLLESGEAKLIEWKNESH